MTDTLNVTIIHGSGGNPQSNWFPWLETELKARNCLVQVPSFPGPDQQNLGSWMSCFKSNVTGIDGSSVLVGHSTGVALILNVLNELQSPIAATFLAGGFVGEIGSAIYDPLNATFFDNKFNWKRICANAGEVFIYAGDNDPYVPLVKGIELSSLLESELILIPGGGHLNYECNFLQFERLLKDFDRWRAAYNCQNAF